MILIIIIFCELLLRISPRIINSLRSYIKHSKECFLLYISKHLEVGLKKLGCASFFQPTSRGVSNGPIQFKSARKIWPLLEFLAKITRVLACSCSQNFCNCSHARILVNMCSIARNFVNPDL